MFVLIDHFSSQVLWQEKYLPNGEHDQVPEKRWCASQEDLANTSHRLTVSSDLPDLIEMYGDPDQDEPLANNSTEEEIFIVKQLSRFDSKASSIPFANSSCCTIYLAPSLASNFNQAVLSGNHSTGPSRSRRRQRRGAIGRMSSSEPQLLVKDFLLYWKLI